MDISNWINNFTFLKTNPFEHFPHVFVHDGFYKVFESIAEDVLYQVHKLRAKYSTAHVIITGHSLGGAVAALCSFYFSTIKEIPVHELYTFGEPRVGDSKFTVMIKEAIPHIYRVTHYRDVVPHLPQEWLGFEHVAQEVGKVYFDAMLDTFS